MEWHFDPYTTIENQKAAIPLPSNSPIDVTVSTVYDAVTRIHSDAVDDIVMSFGLLTYLADIGEY